MKDKIIVKPLSRVTAQVTPIVLSETPKTQMLFLPEQVDNHKEPTKNINGKFVFKKKKTATDDFDDLTKISKRDIQFGEYVEIQLDTTETFNLAKGLIDRFRILHGKLTPLTKEEYQKIDEEISFIRGIIEDNPKLTQILAKIDLTSLNTALNIENLKRIKKEIKANLDNSDEAFWQRQFESNSWVLSQLFSAPFVLFKQQGYMGGKLIDNKGGKYVDYVYKNSLSDNIVLIEIKTPPTVLLGQCYRPDDVFSLSKELSGAINQLLIQRDTLYKNYSALQTNADMQCNADAKLICITAEQFWLLGKLVH